MPNNPALRAIRAFEKDLGPLLEKVAALVQKGLDAGLTPERAVAAAFRRYRVERVLQAGIEAQMVSAVHIATGASAGLAIRRTLLDASFFPDKVPLSGRIHNLALRSVITDEIRGALRAGATFQRLAERLADGGITAGQLPKHLDALLSASRTFAPGDLQFQKAFSKSAGEIARLAQGGAPTGALKAGYLEILDRVKTARPEVLAKRVEVAVLEKARYNAERVARTEIARAWGYAQKEEIASDPDAVGMRWTLSSRHRVYDICDFHAGADLYGMGPGVYPKDESPPYPGHPSCLCNLSPVFTGEAPDGGKFDPKAGASFFGEIGQKEKNALFTKNGAAAVAADPGKWRAELRNWQGQEKVVAGKFGPQ